MFRSRTRRPALDRRGASLMVVLALLTLFAIAGLAFAMYASSAATGSRIFREAEDKKKTDLPDSAEAASLGMQQILFPVDDTNLLALLSAFRGSSMSETMYGYNRAGGNDYPYNGFGPYQENLTITGLPAPIPRTQVVNYSLFRDTVSGTYSIVDAEYTRVGTVRAGATPGAFPAIDTGSVYVGKNANYTYPDRNNILIGMVNPITGEVVVPSGHRYTLFNGWQGVGVSPVETMRLAPPGTNPTLPAAQDDWLTPAGRFRTLRPRPIDHDPDGPGPLQSEFPYPPPNPDGTYTGDVQNQRYTDGRQRNDSVWMMGTPNVINWRGKQIMALYAPLITPLDGRINVNVAGNKPIGGTAHGSNQGFGPWEQNLSHLLPNTANVANGVLDRRHGGATVPATLAGTTTKYFHADPLSAALQVQPYDRSRVDWNAGGTAARMALPANFASDPSWPTSTSAPAGPYDNSDAALEALNHPGLFYPYERTPLALGTALTGPGTYPLTDFKQLARYSTRTGTYNNTVLGQIITTPQGEFLYTGPRNPSAVPTPLIGNENRALITPYSNSLKIHNLAPNFLTDTTLANANTLVFSNAVLPFPYLAARNAAATPLTPVLDFTTLAPNTDGSNNIASPGAVRNVRAALQGIDLNRPLTDYRVSTATELIDTNVNVTTATAARLDRHLLAKDIFNRLAILTGARVTYTGGVLTLPQLDNSIAGFNYTLSAVGVRDEEYNALRWLAQLAVNIVDFIDNDDISSSFVWNAINPAGDPFDVTNAATNNFDPARIQDRVVFGSEKPRLVLNEIYAEVANDQNDVAAMTPANSFKVRFFVELLNPGSTESVGPKALTGNVQLRQTTNNVSSYRINVYSNASTLTNAIADPKNVTGDATPANLQATFTANVTSASGNTSVVEPNDGQYKSVAGTSRYGFAVIGPPLVPTPNDPAFVPDPAVVPEYGYILQKPNNDGGVPGDSLQYDYRRQTQATFEGAGAAAGTHNFLNDFANGHGHAVALQRLANPYIPFDAQTNPYLTVDYVGKVYVHDAIRTFLPPAGMANGQRATPPDPTTHYSVGRVQPYAGNEAVAAIQPDRTTAPPATTYNQTLTLRQMNLNGVTPVGKQISLFRHNGTTPTAPAGTPPADATLRSPFGWLTHLDRRLVNQMELLHVSSYPSHLLTHLFAEPDPAGEPRVQRQELSIAIGNTNAPLYRALESLSVKPWGYGLLDGARVPGKVNVNMIFDERVLRAIFDGQLGGTNYFTDNDVAPTPDVLGSLWSSLNGFRSPNWPTNRTIGGIGVTRDEDPAALLPDRPIRGMGQPKFDANPTGTPPLTYPTGFGDTLVGSGALALSSLRPQHSYIRNEPLRKAYNSLTTTSDTFELKMIVGWFEVRNPGPHSATNPPILGKEVYDLVPGDMRAQFGGVIDRTNLAIDLDATGADRIVGTQRFQPPVDKMWATELTTPPTATTTPNEYYTQFHATGSGATVQIYYDGQLINLTVGTSIRLGTGLNGETIQITGLGYPAAMPTPIPAFDGTTGIATVRYMVIPPAVPLTHRAGEAVTGNMRYGSPGPQTSFDVRLPQARALVPYWTQLPP